MHVERLDLWIETKLLKRRRSKRFTVPKYSRYPNMALRVLSDIEMPFTLQRRDDHKFEFTLFRFKELADSWDDDLAFLICQTLYRVVEGASWMNNIESPHHAEENS
jgi:hypothetical protein